MKKKVLVVSTVHHSDDTRIRERLIRTLAATFDVTYASRAPAPTTQGDHSWVELKGSRLARLARSSLMFARTDVDVVSLHDPELIPFGWIASMRGIKVVFDLHERLPDQVAEKAWIPKPLRGAARLAARLALGFADIAYSVTLAESGYSDLFSRELPVFANYPLVRDWPTRVPGNGSVIYVGDVTRQRGIDLAVEAAGKAGLPIIVIGSYDAEFGTELQEMAHRFGTTLELTGRLPNSDALERVAAASVAISPLRSVGNYEHSLPTKILEYAGVGVPTVASDLAGTREVTGAMPGVILVEPGSVDALVDGLIAAGQAAVQQAAASGAAATRSRFVWPAEQVTEFYSALAG